jgi:translation initiation factor IF-2
MTRVGSVRPGRSFGAQGRSSHRRSSRTPRVQKPQATSQRSARGGGLEGPRDSPHGPQCAEAARGVDRQGGPRPGARPGGDARRGGSATRHGQGPESPPTPGGHLARVSPAQAGPGPGSDRPARTERGATSREARGVPAGRREVGSWTPRLLALLSTHGPPPLRGLPGRVASQGRQPQLREDGEVGEGGWHQGGGRGLGGPGLGPPQPAPRAASAAKLRLCPPRQETFRPGGENTKTNGRQEPVPARLSPRPPFSQPPASPRRCPRPRPTSRRQTTGIWSQRTSARVLPP